MNKKIEAKRTCACNECPVGPGEPVPSKIPFDFESFCGIAQKDEGGSFVSGWVVPCFLSGTHEDCTRYQAFQKIKQELAV